jgi:hypothetical protein
MREDPLRRFAFGITIEDTQLRLWLSNRAFLVVTEPINFFEVRKHITLCVRVLTGIVHLEHRWCYLALLRSWICVCVFCYEKARMGPHCRADP